MAIAEGIYELPDGYRYFLYKRLSNIEKKKEKLVLEQERQRQEILKEEERRKLEKSFQKFFQDIVKKNKRQMNLYKEKAEEILELEGVSRENMMFSLLLDSKIEYLAKIDFDGGNVMDLAEKGSRSLLN